MSSIAFEHGFFWQTLWELPDNAALKGARKDPHALAPGDEVIVPERRRKQQSCAAGQAHRFRYKGVPEKLRVQLLDETGAPRKGLAYVIEADGTRLEGTLDPEGRLEHWISPRLTRGTLTLLLPDDRKEQYDVLLGGVDPADGVRGAQQRLANLGLYAGPYDGQWSEDLCDAVIDFQLARKLEVTGELDDATIAALAEAHGG